MSIDEKRVLKKGTRSLTEMPVAVLGDWDGFQAKRETIISKRVMNKGYWKKQGEIKDIKGHILEVYKSSTKNRFIMGAWGIEDDDRNVFVVIVEGFIIPRGDLKRSLGYFNPVQMSKVETGADFRFQGYGTLFYRWFILNKYSIVSDMVQFDGARNLYASLSKQKDIIVDVIDQDEQTVLIKDTIIDSGVEDWDFDINEKGHIRIVLSKK